MWSFASNAIAGSLKKKAQPSKCSISNPDCSDDEVSSCTSREEGLDCPICWESFNLVENVPYVLWCGHTMCKNCILGLHWAVVKFLPFLSSCHCSSHAPGAICCLSGWCTKATSGSHARTTFCSGWLRA